MVPDDAIYHELVRLRRGRGLQTSALRSRLGPHLSARCGVQGTDNDRIVRQKVANEVRRISGEFPPDLRLAIHVALAIDPRALYGRLEERESWLAGKLHCSPRSARRRVVEASARLAEAVRDRTESDQSVDPEQGWYLRRLKSLMCLDTPTPELYEERTIVAVREELTEISVRSSLPRGGGDDDAHHELLAEVLHGVRLLTVERLGETHFRYLLGLPRVLRRGEELTYTMRYRIPPEQPMRPHYAFLPLVPCESFNVRVRFDPHRPPYAVWRLDRVAPRLLDEQQPGTDDLRLDGAWELALDFADLSQGYGYGVGWQPARPA